MESNNKDHLFQKGHKKVGGRKAGTLNKATVFGLNTIKELLETYSESGLMSKDWLQLDAKDRLSIAEKLMTYIMPKKQSVSGDMTISSTKTPLDEKLKELAELNEKG